MAKFKNMDGSISFETSNERNNENKSKTATKMASTLRSPDHIGEFDGYEERYSTISSLLKNFQETAKNSPVNLRLNRKMKPESLVKRFTVNY